MWAEFLVLRARETNYVGFEFIPSMAVNDLCSMVHRILVIPITEEHKGRLWKIGRYECTLL